MSELVAVTHIADVTVAVEQSALGSSASRVTGVAIVPAPSATKLSPTN